MQFITKIKLALGTAFGLVFLALWFFGGIIGAVVAVVKDDALSAVLSLLIPCYGAIYAMVSAIGAIF